MNFTLPKNRIAPIILFAIISLVVSFILGTYQTNKISQYSYKEKLSTYDSLTDNMVSLIKQGIVNQYQLLQDSADLAAKSGELNKNNIEGILPRLAKDKTYLDLMIVNKEGQGYNLEGNDVDVSAQSYFIQAKKGKINATDYIVYTEDNQPAIIIAAPITSYGENKGVLIAYLSTAISNLAPFKDELDQGSLIYLLNSNNELMFYMQDTDIRSFDYNLIQKGSFRYEAEKAIPTMSIIDFYLKKDNNESTYLWDKKQLGINHWSLLVGRVSTTSPFTKGILRLTNTLWVFTSILLILLFTLMISIQRRSNRKVIKMLYLDPVTGGDNWYRFRFMVSKILSGKQPAKKKYVLINFDINRFKVINDVYGYQKGDRILKEIYQIIRRWSIPGEVFTRYAADQFYILMSFQEKNDLENRIYELNDRLHEYKYTTSTRISFGVYIIEDAQDSVDRMGEFASIAKNKNKSSAGGIISYFDHAARERLLEEEKIEKSMHDALSNNEFEVFLQPKYIASGESISGAEALVRWFNSDGKMVSPGYFIPLFEQNGFIIKLDYYMLKKVCALIRSWLDKGYEPMPISVNISRLHFANPQLAQTISDLVDDYKIPHRLIELELTESALLQNKSMLVETVITLRSKGFLISMDDFGAGYSSLNSLKDLPLDVVKLDGELFSMTNEVERGLTVIRNTITMAKDLHMQVVAECIETKEQVDYLCKVGCDIIQGYYFAKPMPVFQFEQKYLVNSIY